MDCPNCKGHRLVPTKLDVDLVASGCKQCNGALLSLVIYRHWAEQRPAATPETDELEVFDQANDSGKALVCPKCSRLMTKYRVGAGRDNRVDLCASCDEAWLDSGEWQLLKRLELQDQLPQIFTGEWQRRVRRDQSYESFRREYAQTFGSDYSRIRELRSWIDNHPQQAEIRRYLNNPNPYQADC